MSNKKVIIESLAMDLKRSAMGYHRGSLLMARRFKTEAFKRKYELDAMKNSSYLGKLLQEMDKRLSIDKDETGEDALMLSTLSEFSTSFETNLSICLIKKQMRKGQNG